MKTPRMFNFLTGIAVGLAAACWSMAMADPASHRLVIKDDKGSEVHTLMSDQYNAFIAYLESSGQTNALEMFRQYRCANNADLAASRLGWTVAALQSLRQGGTTEAIDLLEKQLGFYSSIMCNSYGCLNATNRGRASLESLEKARAYYARYPVTGGDSMEKTIKEVMRASREQAKQ